MVVFALAAPVAGAEQQQQRQQQQQQQRRQQQQQQQYYHHQNHQHQQQRHQLMPFRPLRPLGPSCLPLSRPVATASAAARAAAAPAGGASLEGSSKFWRASWVRSGGGCRSAGTGRLARFQTRHFPGQAGRGGLPERGGLPGRGKGEAVHWLPSAGPTAMGQKTQLALHCAAGAGVGFLLGSLAGRRAGKMQMQETPESQEKKRDSSSGRGLSQLQSMLSDAVGALPNPTIPSLPKDWIQGSVGLLAKGVTCMLQNLGPWSLEHLTLGLAVIAKVTEREPPPAPGVVLPQDAAAAAFAREASEWNCHAEAAYAGDSASWSLQTGLPESCILSSQWSPESASLRPAYVVSVDWRRRAVVVAVRGTGDPGDMLTNAALHCEDFMGGQVHAGFFHAAKNLLSEIEPHVARGLLSLQRYPYRRERNEGRNKGNQIGVDGQHEQQQQQQQQKQEEEEEEEEAQQQQQWQQQQQNPEQEQQTGPRDCEGRKPAGRLVFVGHSLGAAVAVLAALMMRSGIPESALEGSHHDGGGVEEEAGVGEDGSDKEDYKEDLDDPWWHVGVEEDSDAEKRETTDNAVPGGQEDQTVENDKELDRDREHQGGDGKWGNVSKAKDEETQAADATSSGTAAVQGYPQPSHDRADQGRGWREEEKGILPLGVTVEVAGGSHIAELRCWGFSPPAFLTPEVAESCRPFTTCLFASHDLVPRFSVASVERLRQRVCSYDWGEAERVLGPDDEDWKQLQAARQLLLQVKGMHAHVGSTVSNVQKAVGSGLNGLFQGSDNEVEEEEEAEEGGGILNEEDLERPSSLCDSEPKQDISTFPTLFPPTPLLALTSFPPGSGLSPEERKDAPKQRRYGTFPTMDEAMRAHWVLSKVEAEDVADVVVSKWCISDHMPSTLGEGLTHLMMNGWHEDW